MKNISFHVKNFQKSSSVIFVGKIRTFLEFLEWNMGYLERNSETWKTPGFSGFECRVSGIGRVSIFGFGSGSGSKKVGLFPRVSGFWVQRPITSPTTIIWVQINVARGKMWGCRKYFKNNRFAMTELSQNCTWVFIESNFFGLNL